MDLPPPTFPGSTPPPSLVSSTRKPDEFSEVWLQLHDVHQLALKARTDLLATEKRRVEIDLDRSQTEVNSLKAEVAGLKARLYAMRQQRISPEPPRPTTDVLGPPRPHEAWRIIQDVAASEEEVEQFRGILLGVSSSDVPSVADVRGHLECISQPDVLSRKDRSKTRPEVSWRWIARICAREVLLLQDKHEKSEASRLRVTTFLSRKTEEWRRWREWYGSRGVVTSADPSQTVAVSHGACRKPSVEIQSVERDYTGSVDDAGQDEVIEEVERAIEIPVVDEKEATPAVQDVPPSSPFEAAPNEGHVYVVEGTPEVSLVHSHGHPRNRRALAPSHGKADMNMSLYSSGYIDPLLSTVPGEIVTEIGNDDEMILGEELCTGEEEAIRDQMIREDEEEASRAKRVREEEETAAIERDLVLEDMIREEMIQSEERIQSGEGEVVPGTAVEVLVPPHPLQEAHQDGQPPMRPASYSAYASSNKLRFWVDSVAKFPPSVLPMSPFIEEGAPPPPGPRIEEVPNTQAPSFSSVREAHRRKSVVQHAHLPQTSPVRRGSRSSRESPRPVKTTSEGASRKRSRLEMSSPSRGIRRPLDLIPASRIPEGCPRSTGGSSSRPQA